MVKEHYLHRRPPITRAFGLYEKGRVGWLGVITFGSPASRHMLISALPHAPNLVIELNRLWVSDEMPRNTESWFIAKALGMMPPRIILSYADTARGHQGYVYRASNFFYAGWTDMDRKTPRFDYTVPGKHSREASRCGQWTRVQRQPKVKYWTTTGNRRDRKSLEVACKWPKLDWKTNPPPANSTASF